MTERELLLASFLTFAVLFFTVTLYIIGQLPLVIAAIAGLELILRRYSARRDAATAPITQGETH